MPTEITSKLPEVGTTIFAVMSGLAQAHGAINLSQGFPDFEPAEALLDRVTHHLKSGKNQYPPMIGVPELRRAIADKLRAAGTIEADPDTEITIVSGATEALFCAIHSVVRRGDEVIIFDPAYDCYAPAVALAGGVAVHLPLTTPDYRIDWRAFQAALNRNTRLVIINTPHNPTGTILTADDLHQLSDAINDYDCYVLSDEVYEHIIFDDQPHAGVLAHKELSARSFAVFSFGKTYHATGWKIGYCVAPESLTAEFRKVHQFNTFTTVTPMQYALADFLRDHPNYPAELSAFYQQKRNKFNDLLAPSRFQLPPCHGTYFQLADYSNLSDINDKDFARELTIKHGVAVIPVSVFYKNPPPKKVIRFCFAKQDETLEKAAEILCEL